MIRGLALCAGAGGLELGVGLAEADLRVLCYVERDAPAAALLVGQMEAGRLAPAAVWDDLKTFDARPWRGAVDCVLAGYPCQPFSVAGKRRGAADPRHLWPHVARAVRDARPAHVFLENVSAHLRMGGFDVLRELREMGYDVAAGLFTAEEVGGAHRRERLFIRGELADAECAKRRPRPPVSAGWVETSGLPRNGCDRLASGANVPLFPPAPGDRDAWDAVLAVRPDLAPAVVQSQVRGMADGVASRVDRLRMLGNGVVPLVAAYAWRTLGAALRERARLA